MPIYYADYPIFGLCCTKNSIILSGGGGGKDYGIEDQIELYELADYEEGQKFNANDKISMESSLFLKYVYNTTKQKGVIDSMCFNNKLNLVAGGIRESCILLYVQEKSIKMYLQFQTVWDKSKKGKQSVCRFSKDGKFLITGGTDNTVRVWELNTETKSTSEVIPLEMKEFHGHDTEIMDLDMSFDKRFIISSSRNGTIIVHEYNSGEIFKKFTVPIKNGNYIVRQCRFIENGRLDSPKRVNKSNERQQYIVSMLLHEIRGSSFITVWNMKISKEPNPSENSSNRIMFAQISSSFICDKPSSVLVVSDDYNLLAVGTNTGLIKIFKNNLSELTLVKEGAFHELPVTGLQFFNSGEYIISAGADYSISVLNVKSRKSSSKARKSSTNKQYKRGGVLSFCLNVVKYILIILFIIIFAGAFFSYCTRIGVEVQSFIRENASFSVEL